MSVKLLTEYNLGFLSLKGGCICLFESTIVKMPHCWKSHAMTKIIVNGSGILWNVKRRISITILSSSVDFMV